MKRDGAVGSTLDPTLRAIVAADRLAVSEAGDRGELLARRLVVFYGYFALLSVLGAIVGRAGRFPVDADPGALARLLDVQSAHAFVISATFVALWSRAGGPRVGRALDLLATVSTSVLAAVALSFVPYAPTVDVSAVAFFILFFVVRAALVPSTPWLATLVAAVATAPFLYGLWVSYRNALPTDAWGATFASARAMLGGIAGVYLVSSTIYGLRRVVEQAVELGQYVVHEKIGEGGMGTVYRASHAMLKRPTAIKLIAPDRANEQAIARFEREVLAASRLSHPNNVAVFDFGRTRGGVFYYAMELLDGSDLARLVAQEGPQPSARTLHIARQIASALVEAHDAGLVHRDLKPENVMLCTRGGVRDFVKVLDFGLVKDFTAPPMSAENMIAGTPLYMAPETILAPATVGPATDVYALGCVLYFLLAGRPPFTGSSIVAICSAHVHEAPTPPSAHAPVPEALELLVLRCLDKDPSRRPTARELVCQLDAIAAIDA